MLAGIRSHLTYANVTATLALFLAIGGGAYAALDLPRDSVGSSELKRNAVTPKELHPRTERQLRGTGDTVHERIR